MARRHPDQHEQRRGYGTSHTSSKVFWHHYQGISYDAETVQSQRSKFLKQVIPERQVGELPSLKPIVARVGSESGKEIERAESRNNESGGDDSTHHFYGGATDRRSLAHFLSLSFTPPGSQKRLSPVSASYTDGTPRRRKVVRKRRHLGKQHVVRSKRGGTYAPGSSSAYLEQNQLGNLEIHSDCLPWALFNRSKGWCFVKENKRSLRNM